MNPLITASLITGGTGLLGNALGMFGDGGSDTALNDQRFMNDFAWKQALRNETRQWQLATGGLQIRAADAEAAGIHPLAAMGINPAGGATVAANFQPTTDRYNNRWDRAAGMVKDLGQDVSRAVAAQATPHEKAMRIAQLETEVAQKNALDAEATLKIAQANDLIRNPSRANVDPDLPFNPVAKMRKSIGHVRDGIIGPESYPFWRAVRRAGRRLLTPWRGE